tara:strand:+ start:1232 stop:1657 length:426 start_codon:yes stop_codon:yes gene_type:complete
MKKNIVSKIKKVLQDEGLRFTKQRKAVWDELEYSNDHHDADKIYENLKSNKISVSRATVYRTLDILVKNKFIRKLDVGDGRIRYEAKISKDHHDHMICLETGKIIEFFDEDLENLQDKIAKKYGYKIVRHTHQLFVKPIKK